MGMHEYMYYVCDQIWSSVNCKPIIETHQNYKANIYQGLSNSFEWSPPLTK